MAHSHASCLQGPLIKIITAIIYDLRYFIVVIAILLVGFSCAFAVSMPDNATFDNGTPYGMGLLSSGFLTTYLSMLGAFDIDDYTTPESRLFFVIFLFLILVVMLNLLIAIMSNTFERVLDSWEFEGQKMRVETIIEEELLMDDSHNAAYFPEFLQVLRPVEEAADEWSGVSGQISAVKEEVRHEAEEHEKRVRRAAEEHQERVRREAEEHREEAKKEADTHRENAKKEIEEQWERAKQEAENAKKEAAALLESVKKEAEQHRQNAKKEAEEAAAKAQAKTKAKAKAKAKRRRAQAVKRRAQRKARPQYKRRTVTFVMLDAGQQPPNNKKRGKSKGKGAGKAKMVSRRSKPLPYAIKLPPPSDAEDEGARWGDGDGDASRKYALETRLRKMRALPKGSRYAKQQCELIEKALDILARGKRRGARSAEEEDELAGLLKAVKL